MDIKEQILVTATQLFMKYGLKSLSMDDLARELKMSKKTLYQFFDSKSSMVADVMENHVRENQANITDICKRSKNAIDEVLLINEHLHEQLKDLNPSVHFDLKKYYKQAWEAFNCYKSDFIFNCVVKNIERGIREGIYRKEINPKILAKVYVIRIDYLFDPEIFPPKEFTFVEVNKQVANYHLGGLVNEKGYAYLKEHRRL